MSSDPYVYPGTTVLRNAPGIRDADELRRVEGRLTSLRAARLAAERLLGRYDLAHPRAFHRALFEGLYEWAGELRTVAIGKPGALFCLPEHIESYGAEVFGRLARERHLTGLGRVRFVDRLAVYLADVNALHPFREGNGRAQRALFGQLAADAGYRLQWQRVGPERNIEASSAAMRGDNGPLRELLDAITEPTGRARRAPAQRTAARLRELHAERDRLAAERAALPDPPVTRRDATRRLAYDRALERVDRGIAGAEREHGGPLTPQDLDALDDEEAERRAGLARPRDRLARGDRGLGLEFD